MSEVSKGERIIWMDYARAIAILLVVLNHAVQLAQPIEEWGADTLQSFPLMLSLFTLGRHGVPVFLSLTGALLLSRPMEGDKSVFAFYRRNLLRLLICTEIWIVLYTLMLPLVSATPLRLPMFIKNILFITNVPEFFNMWYMPMILGVYLMLPFVGAVVRRFSFKALSLPMVVVFIACSVLPTLNIHLYHADIATLESQLSLDFGGGLYGLYVLVGYYLSRGVLQRVKTLWIAVGFLVFFALTVGMEIWYFQHGISYTVWYNFATLVFSGLLFTELLRRAFSRPGVKPGRAAGWLSRASLAMFFVHVPIQLLLMKAALFSQLPELFSVLALFASSFVLSVGVVWLLSLVPPVKKYVLLMKG